MSKLKLYHFYNGNGGGVHSVIKNLLRFSQNPAIENHVIHAINQQIHPSYTIEPMEGAASEQLCLYSPKDNFYHTCKKLAACLPDEKAVVIAHDWIELGMMSNLGLQNKVVYFLHGDFEYYYNLALKHIKTIDAYVCISPVIFNKLKLLLPGKEEKIFKCYFPVPEVETIKKNNDELNIVFAVRDICEERKNFSLLPEIDHLLPQQNINWHIAGGMSKPDYGNSVLKELKSYTYYSVLSNAEVLNLFRSMHIFLLPSSTEGLPVSLVEAMKSGVVPLIPNWCGATDEFLQDGIHGFYISNSDSKSYAQKITELYVDETMLNLLSENCTSSANAFFNAIRNTEKIEDVFIKTYALKFVQKHPTKVYGSRLDKPWMPNWIVKLIRK